MLSNTMRRNQQVFVKDTISPADCSSPGNSVQIPVFHATSTSENAAEISPAGHGRHAWRSRTRPA